ncbi:hypothetical protein JYU34_018421 [Plutella xylostella]|uniref:Uncharacterized protein n=1 Tax=Plutella xylostella TaxID=51655 RepID=A0ABQ7PXJ3_PLUXY|nr:hypothetical protein JYU34_018421 [Plutella xylostella]
MSTRSGKRIHKSFHENILNGDGNADNKIERATRSRRLKENCDALNISLPKVKKNYVSYPSEDAEATAAVPAADEDLGASRTTRKNALKEQDANVTTNTSDSESKKNTVVRKTRRTRRFNDPGEDGNSDSTVPDAAVIEVLTKKTKKGKKNKQKVDIEEVVDKEKENEVEPAQAQPKQKKSKKKKKKGVRNSTSMTIEEVVPQEPSGKLKSLNNTNTSIESFHSAAGSPIVTDNQSTKLNGTFEKTKTENKVPKNLDSTFEKVSETLSTSIQDKKNKSIEKSSKRKRNSSAKRVAETEVEQDELSVSDDQPGPELNSSKRKRKSSAVSYKDATFDKSSEADIAGNVSVVLNTTFDKDLAATHEPVVNTTFDKNEPTTEAVANATFEKEGKSQRKSLRISNVSEKLSTSVTVQNSTFDKSDTTKKTEKSIDTTFDKSSDNKTLDTKLNSTFDKTETTNKLSSVSKSSIISSDNSHEIVNSTFDKTNENISRISITDDDSTTENILNATPVLIESSMETSDLSEDTPPPSKPVTPPVLQREGTFTKDGPDPIIIDTKSPRASSGPVRTPIKRKMSLPSPGCTPFHSNTKASTKEKSVLLNVTRSIEKARRSSLADPSSLVGPARARVAFCSPVDTPALDTHRKSKVIKSSMKGSNKSFLFEDGPAPRPAGRKRSFTHGDADERCVKRTRLEQSVERLSRPRAAPPAPAAPQTTPSKARPPTPKAKSETKARKLPNFAALHQRQFHKMESLDECQERKRKRARQLLVPTGKLTVLDRSPRGKHNIWGHLTLAQATLS